MCIRENGKTNNRMDLEFSLPLMEGGRVTDMKESGKMVNNMGKEFNFLKMEIGKKENTGKGSPMDGAFIMMKRRE